MSTRGNTTKVFKKYIPSKIGKSKLGVSILLDASGSMSPDAYDKAVQGAWCINQALWQTHDKCSVIEYSDDYKVLKGFYNPKGAWGRHFSGGTDPQGALGYTLRNQKRLKKSENINTQVMFIFTDGDWFNPQPCEEIIKRMRKEDIYTVLIDTSSNGGTAHPHGVNEAHKILNTDELEGVMRKVIVKLQQKILYG
jgi:uncharacterized protein with von Willebrand factor type A (vWA) domain